MPGPKVRDMPRGGLQGWISTQIGGYFSDLMNSLNYGALLLWNVFVSFLDTVFSFTGTPDAFSRFIALLTSFWGWLVTSSSWLLSLLGDGFTGLLVVMTSFVDIFTMAVNNFVSMIYWINQLLMGGLTAGINIWEDYNMNQWIQILLILYPVFLFYLMVEKGGQALADHISFMFNVFSFIIGLFLRVIEFAIRIVTAIIESIPIIE